MKGITDNLQPRGMCVCLRTRTRLACASANCVFPHITPHDFLIATFDCGSPNGIDYQFGNRQSNSAIVNRQYGNRLNPYRKDEHTASAFAASRVECPAMCLRDACGRGEGGAGRNPAWPLKPFQIGQPRELIR